MAVRRGWLSGFLAVVMMLAGSMAASAEKETVLAAREGDATYYADRFHGRTTASGVRFSNNRMMAAHLTWPFGTIVRVKALKSGKSTTVEIVDRIGKSATAIIDLSQEAADRLGFLDTGEGKIPVRLEVLEWGDNAED